MTRSIVTRIKERAWARTIAACASMEPNARTKASMFNPDLKRGSLELLILSVLEAESRHGYEIGKHIERRSGGELELTASTLYSILYRMEDRGWIKGRWVERKGERRRCYYSVTPKGGEVLEAQKREWQAFAAMVNKVIGVSPA